ncbi:hypothetical protein HMSSN036_33350 [Paenibacillus macerans]|nr:hypothetical protein HMSSN036_33350 [Paenibacillus macerans]
MPDEPFDAPLGEYSGAGTIFGVTGGVMEAAIRTGYELLTEQEIPRLQLDFVRGEEGIRTADVQVGELELKVAVVAGLQHVGPVLRAVADGTCPYHFIEVMACPAGCISGGGQPKLLTEQMRELAIGPGKARFTVMMPGCLYAKHMKTRGSKNCTKMFWASRWAAFRTICCIPISSPGESPRK